MGIVAVLATLALGVYLVAFVARVCQRWSVFTNRKLPDLTKLGGSFGDFGGLAGFGEATEDLAEAQDQLGDQIQTLREYAQATRDAHIELEEKHNTLNRAVYELVGRVLPDDASLEGVGDDDGQEKAVESDSE